MTTSTKWCCGCCPVNQQWPDQGAEAGVVADTPMRQASSRNTSAPCNHVNRCPGSQELQRNAPTSRKRFQNKSCPCAWPVRSGLPTSHKGGKCDRHRGAEIN